MADQFNEQFKDNTPKPEANNTPAEVPFQAERELRPSASNDRIEGRLQALSPDKQVIEAKNLSSLDPQQLASLKATLSHAAELWNKVEEPLRNVYSNWKRQELDGNDESKGEWSKNYFHKVENVLRENMNELANEIPIRVAFPVQSFLPDSKGQMKGEMLYAFYPPLQANIKEQYITFPLHSPDPQREAQLRREGGIGSSLGCSISSGEQVFRFKVNSLLDRRERSASA